MDNTQKISSPLIDVNINNNKISLLVNSSHNILKLKPGAYFDVYDGDIKGGSKVTFKCSGPVNPLGKFASVPIDPSSIKDLILIMCTLY